MQITIGIPSYNEEVSIRTILEALERQVTNGHEICEVIISDDSTDTTPEIVNDFARKSTLSITLMHHNKRRGAASAWNEIFRNARGDVTMLYDADIIPAKNTTYLLASRIRDDVVLCASNPLPLEENGIAAKASFFNAQWLHRIRKRILSQYTVMGRALSIRTDVAKTIAIPDVIAIDLYLQCKILELGKKVDYCDEAVVWFKPANTMLDFASQVVRAIQGHEQMKDYVENLDIRLPTSLMLKESIKEVFSRPQNIVAVAIAYLLLPIYKSKVSRYTRSAAWHVADSTKGISVDDLPE